ncbi:MAG: NAD-dependent epimerase/dehydratase family protein [Archangium sp.]|nr:NAD-dependent epimerase/dehydratase family protein [Archangium sp.]
MRDKHIVVLGGAGFLGSHLVDRVLNDGAVRVTAIDDLSTGRVRNLEAAQRDPRFAFIRHDITSPIPHSGPVDVVFNLASPASPKDYESRWLETMRVGSIGTQHGLELAHAREAVFVQASTSEVYGDPLEHPQQESYAGNVDPTSPRSVYDEAKRYGEALVSAFGRKKKLSTRIARIFNTYGPRMRLDDGRVVPQFIAQALSGDDFTVQGDGSQTRSFCFVTDLIDGLVKLAAAEVFLPVNLGNPQELTVLELANAVKRAAGGGSGQIVFRELPTGDPKRRRPDISRAQSLLGWSPRVSLSDGLATTLESFRAA